MCRSRSTLDLVFFSFISACCFRLFSGPCGSDGCVVKFTLDLAKHPDADTYPDAAKVAKNLMKVTRHVSV